MNDNIKKMLLEDVSYNGANQDIKMLMSKIDVIIRKHFKKSYLNVEFRPGNWEEIIVTFSVGAKEDWPNNNIGNDVFSNRIGIDLSDGIKNPKTFIYWEGIYTIMKDGKPKRIKLPFPEKKMNANNIVKEISAYYKRVKTSLANDKDDLLERHKYISKYL